MKQHEHYPRMNLTHWGLDGSIHPGTLTNCSQPDCVVSTDKCDSCMMNRATITTGDADGMTFHLCAVCAEAVRRGTN